jgi:hypothetical protein
VKRERDVFLLLTEYEIIGVKLAAVHQQLIMI